MPENEKDELEIQADGSDTEEEAHVEYAIASYPSDFTLSGINESWLKKDLTIPDFQREFVWSITQSSLLIESFLLGLPVPPVFFYIDKENNNLVIDGQQRILSIIYFFSGFFGSENVQGKRQVFRLTGLNVKSPFAGKTFSDLEEAQKRKIRNAVLRAINIKQISPVDEGTCMFHIFERLNTGGTPLKPQEIRNCVFRGDFIQVLRELNIDDNWRKIIGKSKVDKHQRDVELVLRMFSLFKNVADYEKPMKEYMNVAMKTNKAGDTDKVLEFKQIFPTATKLIVDALGKKPFHVRGPLNAAVMDSVLPVVLENYGSIDNKFKERFITLIGNDDFRKKTLFATTDAATLKERYELTKKILLH